MLELDIGFGQLLLQSLNLLQLFHLSYQHRRGYWLDVDHALVIRNSGCCVLEPIQHCLTRLYRLRLSFDFEALSDGYSLPMVCCLKWVETNL